LRELRPPFRQRRLRQADRRGGPGRLELDAVDVDVSALGGAAEHVVERLAGLREVRGLQGEHDRRFELHGRILVETPAWRNRRGTAIRGHRLDHDHHKAGRCRSRFATVTRSGFYRADLPADAGGYAGRSPEIGVEL
jgi:hypothetical protein